MNALDHKRAQHTQLTTFLDTLIRDNPAPSPYADAKIADIQRVRGQLTELERQMQAEPLEVAEVIELANVDYRGLRFIVNQILDGDNGPQISLRHPCGPDFGSFSRQQLDRLGLKRWGKWSGHGSIPPITATVLVVINTLGLATVVAHEIHNGWLGLQVRFHQPPALWHLRHSQNTNPYGVVFGKEIRW